MTKPTTYNHAYSIAFEVPGSTDEHGEDVTQEQMISAMLRRLANLIDNNEVVEAADCPYDTYEETK